MIKKLILGEPIALVAVGLLIVLFAHLQPSIAATVIEVGEKYYTPASNNMQEYPRREQFEYFRSLSYPHVGVTVEVDVTGMVRYCRSSGYSFYLTFMHAVALAADGVPELRQRIHNDEIVEYDECPTSHVELLADGTYTYCTLHHHMGMEQYMAEALAAREACRKKTGIKEDDDAESMYFISTLPWLHYSAMIQPVAGGDESNPRITWGKRLIFCLLSKTDVDKDWSGCYNCTNLIH